MVAYSFQARFAPLVEAGVKTQTIRAHRKRHARPGEAIQLYQGMRTKHCRKLVDPDPVCTAVRPILIDETGIRFGGNWLNPDQQIALAQADGFTSWHDMLLWWKKTHADLPFEGVLIEWEIAR